MTTKIRIPRLKLPVVLTSGHMADVTASQYEWRKALSDWYAAINKQFGCSDRREREQVLDVLLERRDMTGYALIFRGRELKAVSLVDLIWHLADEWQLYRCKHNQRADVQKVKTYGLPERERPSVPYKGSVEMAIAFGDIGKSQCQIFTSWRARRATPESLLESMNMKGSSYIYIRREFEGEVEAQGVVVNRPPSLRVHRNGIHDGNSFDRDWRSQANKWLTDRQLTLADSGMLSLFCQTGVKP